MWCVQGTNDRAADMGGKDCVDSEPRETNRDFKLVQQDK